MDNFGRVISRLDELNTNFETRNRMEKNEEIIVTREKEEEERKWSTGKPFGTVQKGYVKDSSDPNLLAHHAKGLALLHQIDELRQKKNE